MSVMYLIYFHRHSLITASQEPLLCQSLSHYSANGNTILMAAHKFYHNHKNKGSKAYTKHVIYLIKNLN